MYELSILELERETVELLPPREALKYKPSFKKIKKIAVANAFAVAGDGGDGGRGGNGSVDVEINQDGRASAKGDYSVAIVHNEANVLVNNSGNGGDGGDGGRGGNADADAKARNR